MTLTRKEHVSLSHSLAIDGEELRHRKAFLQFDEADVARLAGINDIAVQYADEVVDDFYTHLLRFDETRSFFTDPDVLERVKYAQKEYFKRLTAGHYIAEYVENRLQIGSLHERSGMPVKSYLGMYNFYLRSVAERLFADGRTESKQALDTFLSLMKLTFLDMGLSIDTYIDSRERTIVEQQSAIRELSTPALPFRPGILSLPVVGMIDSYRAAQLTENLLHAIREHRAIYVVVDITGVPYVDSRVASHLCRVLKLPG